MGWFTLYNHYYEPKTGYDMTSEIYLERSQKYYAQKSCYL